MTVNVGIARCESYNSNEIYEAIKKAISYSGDFPDVKGKRVLLKPNLVAEVENGIEGAVCTHPEIVYAVGRIILENGGIVDINDSPGGGVPNTPAGVKKIYSACGIDKVAEKLGVNLSYELGYQHRTNHSGKQNKEFKIINSVCEADIIISLPKLKTHLFMKYTGAVKNTFGVIPGATKSLFHSMFPNPSIFANMLIDVNELVKPNYTIIDAVMGMEGDGPSGGKPRFIGYILASPSVYAIDVIGQQLIGINPTDVPTSKAAIERNLLQVNTISVNGDKYVPITDFRMPSTYNNFVPNNQLSAFILKLRRSITQNIVNSSSFSIPYPYLSEGICNFCQQCIKACKFSAISVKEGKIIFNHKKCQHCNQCFAQCPENAIHMFPKGFVVSNLRKGLSKSPTIIKEKCVACGRCIRICPMNMISFIDKKADIDLSKCIRCYCCHEMCGYGAISLKDTPLQSLYHKLRK